MPEESEHWKTLFEHAPISLWEEDFSAIKRQFDALRQQGVESLQSYLDIHPEFVEQCMRQIVVADVNQQTLVMFNARTKAQLLEHLGQVFRDGMRQHFQGELLALWNGDLSWSGEGLNYTLDGLPLDILLHWRILPGSEKTWREVLVTIENITPRKQAERELLVSRARFQKMFDASPISLWEEDYSAIKAEFDSLRARGVTDLERHLALDPQAALRFAGLIKVLNVNQKTLDLFCARSKEHLLANLGNIFRDEMGAHFARELVDMWNGKLAYERESVNYCLNGEPIHIHIDFCIMPGHEQDFSWAVVAIQDITARKKAEEYLRYLGTHDVMTGLFNRAHFEETLTRFEKGGCEPVSVIIADLNGLKTVNDTYGHQAGDSLIRRAAEVLKASFDRAHSVARIGGDEFAVLMPETPEAAAREGLARIQSLISLNNKYYGSPELSMALGAATRAPGISLEKVISLADNAMYQRKAAHHQRLRDG